MLRTWQGFGEEISHVNRTGHVLNQKLEPLDPILDPVKSHVDAFRQLGDHGLLGKADGAFVVTQDQGGQLGVAHITKGPALDVANAGSGE